MKWYKPSFNRKYMYETLLELFPEMLQLKSNKSFNKKGVFLLTHNFSVISYEGGIGVYGIVV